MSRLISTVVTILALAFALLPAGQAAAAEPEDVIRSIYEAYGPESFPEDPVGAHFTPELLSLWNEVQDGAGDDIEYAVDFDPFLNAQDVDTVQNLAFTRREDGPDRVELDATFQVFGQDMSVTYTMVPSDGTWKIDDISWTPESSLRVTLEELKQAQAER